MTDQPAGGKSRARLIALLGMLGSDYLGEVINAAKLANRLAKELGGWPALLDRSALEHELGVAVAAIHELLARNERLERELRRERARTAPQVRWVEPVTPSEKLDRCCENARFCSEWERDFLVSIASRRRLSEKQTACLDKIVVKIGRLVRLTG
jgi:hypothetical protein